MGIMKKVKQEVIDKWENFGFLEGLEEDAKKVVVQTFEYNKSWSITPP